MLLPPEVAKGMTVFLWKYLMQVGTCHLCQLLGNALCYTRC